MNKIKQIFSLLKKLRTRRALFFLSIALFLLFGSIFLITRKSNISFKEHRFLVATDSRWSTLDLHGQEQYMQGFVSELLQSIANYEEIHLQVIVVPPSQLFDNMEKGYYDGVISNLIPDTYNREKYFFSEPFYPIGPVLVVPLNSTATSVADLNILGTKTGNSTVFQVRGEPRVSTFHYDSTNNALSDLISGKIDGLVLDSLDAYAYVQGYYVDKLKIVTPPLNHSGLRLITMDTAFGKKLVKVFDSGLEEIKNEKIYDKILKNWDLVNPETSYQK